MTKMVCAAFWAMGTFASRAMIEACAVYLFERYSRAREDEEERALPKSPKKRLDATDYVM